MSTSPDAKDRKLDMVYPDGFNEANDTEGMDTDAFYGSDTFESDLDNELELEVLLEGLKEEEIDFLKAVYQDGVSISKIADDTKISRQAVYTRMDRIKSKVLHNFRKKNISTGAKL